MGDLPILDFPLRGVWRIMNPPGHPAHAFDCLAVGGPKHRFVSTSYARWFFAESSVSEWYGWGQPVFAPVDGEVVTAIDTVQDRTKLNAVRDFFWTTLYTALAYSNRSGPDLRPHAGNFVIIQSGSVACLLAHFQARSIEVRPGALVEAGQRLGLVGNSGNSLVPHLHLQVMDNSDPWRAAVLPFRIRRCERWDGETWKEEHFVTLVGGQTIKM